MSSNSSEHHALEQLRAIRPLLLRLHKDLMEGVRIAYEEEHGTIPSTGEYFRLVLGHESFSWLRPISQLIVRVDERMAAKKPELAENAELLVSEVHNLLALLEEDSEQHHHYHQALKYNPNITVIYAEAIKLLTL
jgi:hypothetical protein